MKIEKQNEGVALTDEERKVFTALLVKLGYTVRVRREKPIKGGGVARVVICAEETEIEKESRK